MLDVFGQRLGLLFDSIDPDLASSKLLNGLIGGILIYDRKLLTTDVLTLCTCVFKG